MLTIVIRHTDEDEDDEDDEDEDDEDDPLAKEFEKVALMDSSVVVITVRKNEVVNLGGHDDEIHAGQHMIRSNVSIEVLVNEKKLEARYVNKVIHYA